MSEYIVGIDLGTTNCALSYLPDQPDSIGEHLPQILDVPQLVRPNDLKARPTLPSFLYLATENEFASGALSLPWAQTSTFMVGEGARERGAQVPGQLISSSKSWLSHHAADREGPILPPQAEGISPISPVEAAQRYLRHLAGAWDHAHPDAPLRDQKVFLTVPASFDAVARELTVKAAALAGLSEVTLLEEPQAAFYAWLAEIGDLWRDMLQPGDRVLVCDVGGGTTDYSMIEVHDVDGQLQLSRVAVGDHLLLGGDNMDLALAHVLHERLTTANKRLDAAQQRALVLGARRAKEILLADPAAVKHTVTVLGQGRRLFGNKTTVDLDRQTMENIVFEGFFPSCGPDAAPEEGHRAGFMEFGLPYASDAAITRHLATFVRNHGKQAAPTHILFNGGVFNAPILRERILDVMSSWGTTPQVLEGGDRDLAVARGAAWFGAVREAGGLRIRGGTARSYWIGMEVARPAIPGLPPPIRALCVVPHGMEEGTEATVPDQTLGLVVGQSATFKFLSCSTRPGDAIGTVLDEYTWPGELEETNPMTTTLEADDLDPGTIVPVEVRAQLTEIGTLQLWCVSKEDGRRFRLEFSVRA